MWLRKSSPLPRLLTALVGMVLLVSMLPAQAERCQCCFDGSGSPADRGEESNSTSNACCMMGGQDDAAGQQHRDSGRGQDDASDPCECPLEFSQPEREARLAAYSPRTSAQELLPAAIAAQPVTATAPVVTEHFPAWRPTRGSPHGGVPLHLLHSILII